MVAMADPQEPRIPRAKLKIDYVCVGFIIDGHRWCVQGSGWLQLAMRHLRPALLPLSSEYLFMLEHHQLASFANPWAHHSHTTSQLLPQAL